MIGFRRAPPAPKLYKLYAKSSRGSEQLKRIQEEAQALINRAARKDAKHLLSQVEGGAKLEGPRKINFFSER
jgi:hypothetical protein